MKFFNWFKEMGTAIQVVNAVDGSINSFPNIDTKKLNYLVDKREKWINDKEVIRKRVIEGYSKKINLDNYKKLSNQYLDFYKLLFPDDNTTELQKLMNLHELDTFILSRINNDDALDPTEINEIIEKSKSLSISDYDENWKVKDKFHYYILNWELDNGIFTSKKTDFILQKNETCIFSNNSTELFERKQVTKRVNYGGPRVRLKIAKGLSYNVGSYKISYNKETVEVLKGTGLVNITTKRILFKSHEKSLTIGLNSIIDIEPFSDAVIVTKSTGNPLVFKLKESIGFYQHLNGAIRNL